ncbi:hypothetical protein [Sulfitobacter sp.]|uniref:hypothetical protein n=1 Tax=Sulfitobacter sp. TaxID=1903071 RepID=UPI003F6C6298
MRNIFLITLLAACPTFAAAQVVSYTVDLTPESDHFNRAVSVGGGLSSSGSNVPYQAIPVTVTDGANFYMTTTGGTLGDGYMFVYSSFDPSDATLGRVLADDDTYGLLPSIGPTHGDAPLTNGDYDIVVTAFGNGDYGTIIFDVFGIILNLGPTIASMAEDLTLQHGQYLLASAATKGRAIAAAVRGEMNGSTVTVSTKGMGDIGWAPAMRKAWVTASYQNMNGDVAGHFSQLQAGLDQTLQTGGVLGVSLAFDSHNSSTASSSAKGQTVTLQPYFATKLGELDAVFALSYGITDYSSYTSGATTGTASARSLELSAHIERTIALDGSRSVRPFADLALGRAAMSFGGGLAGAADTAFSTRRAAIGVEVVQALTGGGFEPGSHIYGRIEAMHASNSGPSTSFAVTNPAARNSGSVAIGANLVTQKNTAFKFEAVAGDIGKGKPNFGVSGNLAITF